MFALLYQLMQQYIWTHCDFIRCWWYYRHRWNLCTWFHMVLKRWLCTSKKDTTTRQCTSLKMVYISKKLYALHCLFFFFSKFELYLIRFKPEEQQWHIEGWYSERHRQNRFYSWLSQLRGESHEVILNSMIADKF